MSRDGSITEHFAGEERRFRLTPTKGWRAVQERCDAGPPVIAARLMTAPEPDLPEGTPEAIRALALQNWVRGGGMGAWRVDDIREVILQGLIGGGMDSIAASRLVAQYVDGEPLLPKVPLALSIVLASLTGPEDEPLGEPKGEEPASQPSPEASSGSATSTA